MLTIQGLALNYGLEFDINDPLLQEIVIVEKEINLARSVIHNKQDYLPFLRIWPFGNNKRAKEFRERRDIYMNSLLQMLQKNIKDGKCVPCISGNILQKDKTGQQQVKHQELRSICLTMVSAGLDTIPASIVSCIGHLSNPYYGKRLQERAYYEIQNNYPKGDAWARCIDDEFIPYISSLIKETLRYSSAQPISLPRQTVKDIIYKDSIIPSGTILLMNSLAANFDPNHFINPFLFNPDRFKSSVPGKLEHMGFGAGSRMCAGEKLAEREMYVTIVRLILEFRIYPSANPTKRMNTNIVATFEKVDNMVVEPEPFLVRLEKR